MSTAEWPGDPFAICKSILGQIREGVFFVDSRGVLVFANETAACLISESGRLVEDRPFFNQCRGPVADKLHEVFHKLQTDPTGPISASGKSGRFFFDADCHAVLDKNGVFLGVLGVLRDVTERRRYTRIMRQMASIDPLTRLYNRRHFYMKLREESLRARRQGYPLSLVILDLDDFKEVNDRLGHLKGDSILRAVGEAINRGVRKDVDIPCRYGGDEFTVILPETNLNQAATVARRIADEVHAATEPHLTTSGGVAELGDRNPETLVHIADKALFRAKKLGGDLIFMEHEKQSV